MNKTARFQVTSAEDGSPDMTLRAWLAGQALAGLAANITIREYPMETAARAVELADETLTTLALVKRPRRRAT